jgi:hypothetical protein
LKKSFDTAVQDLHDVSHRFDADANARKLQLLQGLRTRSLTSSKGLPLYHQTLLFISAHPPNRALLAIVEGELRRLAAFMKQHRTGHAPHLQNEGLPFADTVTRFSHDCLGWLLEHPHCRVRVEPIGEPTIDYNALLRLTLPSLEWNETTASLANDQLLDTLRVAKNRRLEFIVNELSRFDGEPFLKDHLFDALDLYVRVSPSDRRFSKAYNRLPMDGVYYQTELARHFDVMALVNQRLPTPRHLEAPDRAEVIGVIRNSFVLTGRETDPGTYLDERSLRLYDLERGLSVAIYGMTPPRQLPLESYVGFTLFKNGLPAAYGGSWLLGERANFGMNIFEPFRGGESGMMMSQVLRLYRGLFGVAYFEVDAHQFGLDNPEGITSGAFWFYYRYGFRPIDRTLYDRAEQERERLSRRSGLRTSAKMLRGFTGSNVALNFGDSVPTHLFDLTTRVTLLVQKNYRDDRIQAERDCIKRFEAKTSAMRKLTPDQRRVLGEVALLSEAMPVTEEAPLALLRRMVRTKPKDLFAYQRLLLRFFASLRR